MIVQSYFASLNFQEAYVQTQIIWVETTLLSLIRRFFVSFTLIFSPYKVCGPYTIRKENSVLFLNHSALCLSLSVLLSFCLYVCCLFMRSDFEILAEQIFFKQMLQDEERKKLNYLYFPEQWEMERKINNIVFMCVLL